MYLQQLVFLFVVAGIVLGQPPDSERRELASKRSGSPPSEPEERTQWLDKMQRFLKVLDVDSDGIITQREYVDLTSERAEKYLGREQGKALKDTLAEAWTDFAALPENGYIANFDLADLDDLATRVATHEHLAGDLRLWARGCFEAADTDTDTNDVLTPEEHKALLKVFNVRDDKAVSKSFKFLDANHNGVIEKAEYVEACVAYFYDTKNPSSLFGPL